MESLEDEVLEFDLVDELKVDLLGEADEAVGVKDRVNHLEVGNGCSDCYDSALDVGHVLGLEVGDDDFGRVDVLECNDGGGFERRVDRVERDVLDGDALGVLDVEEVGLGGDVIEEDVFDRECG